MPDFCKGMDPGKMYSPDPYLLILSWILKFHLYLIL